MAYTADINIVVKGQAAVNKLQRDLIELGQKLDEITKRRIGPSTALQTFNAQLQEAKRRLTEVAAATPAETAAVKNYVTALGNANAALERQNNLIASEIKLRESATNQLEKLAQRQAEFTARTDDTAQAANRQTAAFLRQKRIALEVAKINAAAPAAQLLLAPAAAGAPAMSGGARRRITGPVERLGGARTDDEAQRGLRLAQGLKEQVTPLSQIKFLYAGIAGEAAKLSRIKALPSSEMLNAAARGLQTIDSIEQRRVTRAQRIGNKLQQIENYYGDTGMANAGFGKQGPAVPPGGIPRRSGGGGSNVGGAFSSALIGGGFPLLFGQGPAAAAGGALGGAAGGLLGGGFGFALSIVGTALGDAITKAEAFNKSLSTLNAGLSTTGSTSITTADDVGKLASSLSVTKDEAIELLNTFKQFRDGDTREALAALFAPVGGAATFEAIAKAGIDEKNALSAIFSLRKEIGNDAAIQLALQLKSVGATATQSKLLEIVLDRSIEISVARANEVKFTDRLLSIWEGIIAGLAQAVGLATRFIAKMQEGSFIKLPFLDKISAVLGGVTDRTPEEIAQERGQDAAQRLKADRERIRRALAVETGAVALENRLGESYKAGAKPPEDRTAKLQDELTAIESIAAAENEIRDLLFEGRDVRATVVELAKALFDIERDRKNALREANYDTERALINQIAETRILDARLKQQDKERDINQKRFEEELQIQEAVRSSVQVFTDIRKERELDLQYTKTYSRLLMEGVLPAEAERIANFEKIIAAKLKENEIETALVTAAIEKAKQDKLSTDDLERRLKLLGLVKTAITGEAAAGPGAGPTDRERLQTEADRVRGELNTLIDPINLITNAAAGIGDAFANSFKGIIDGSLSAKEALAGFFQSVADQFLDMAAQIIAEWIKLTILNSILQLFPGGSVAGGGGFGAGGAGFGGSNAFGSFDAGGGLAFGGGLNLLPGRAKGGPVSGGQMYMVGERGPELFVPGRSGTIVPNDKMGGGTTNVVVNVDAKGSSVEGNEQGANQLGRVISAAVQSELIKQQRPGGLLAR